MVWFPPRLPRRSAELAAELCDGNDVIDQTVIKDIAEGQRSILEDLEDDDPFSNDVPSSDGDGHLRDEYTTRKRQRGGATHHNPDGVVVGNASSPIHNNNNNSRGRCRDKGQPKMKRKIRRHVVFPFLSSEEDAAWVEAYHLMSQCGFRFYHIADQTTTTPRKPPTAATVDAWRATSPCVSPTARRHGRRGDLVHSLGFAPDDDLYVYFFVLRMASASGGQLQQNHGDGLLTLSLPHAFNDQCLTRVTLYRVRRSELVVTACSDVEFVVRERAQQCSMKQHKSITTENAPPAWLRSLLVSDSSCTVVCTFDLCVPFVDIIAPERAQRDPLDRQTLKIVMSCRHISLAVLHAAADDDDDGHADDTNANNDNERAQKVGLDFVLHDLCLLRRDHLKHMYTTSQVLGEVVSVMSRAGDEEGEEGEGRQKAIKETIETCLGLNDHHREPLLHAVRCTSNDKNKALRFPHEFLCAGIMQLYTTRPHQLPLTTDLDMFESLDRHITVANDEREKKLRARRRRGSLFQYGIRAPTRTRSASAPAMMLAAGATVVCQDISAAATADARELDDACLTANVAHHALTSRRCDGVEGEQVPGIGIIDCRNATQPTHKGFEEDYGDASVVQQQQQQQQQQSRREPASHATMQGGNNSSTTTTTAATTTTTTFEEEKTTSSCANALFVQQTRNLTKNAEMVAQIQELEQTEKELKTRLHALRQVAAGLKGDVLVGSQRNAERRQALANLEAKIGEVHVQYQQLQRAVECGDQVSSCVGGFIERNTREGSSTLHEFLAVASQALHGTNPTELRTIANDADELRILADKSLMEAMQREKTLRCKNACSRRGEHCD